MYFFFLFAILVSFLEKWRDICTFFFFFRFPFFLPNCQWNKKLPKGNILCECEKASQTTMAISFNFLKSYKMPWKHTELANKDLLEWCITVEWDELTKLKLSVGLTAVKWHPGIPVSTVHIRGSVSFVWTKKVCFGEFSGSLVVSTWGFHCWGLGSTLGQGTKFS